MHLAPPTWRFVPSNFDAGCLSNIEPLFADLQQRPITSVTDLSRWLEDESELLSRISAEEARAYIEKTKHTDDEAAKDHYLRLQREVMPRVEILSNQLDHRFLDCPQRAELPPDEYGMIIRKRENAREIFRPENTELQVEEAELQTRQQALMGAIVVQFAGKGYTPQQMAPFYLDPDRDVRRRAHDAALTARRATWEPLQEIFNELVALRHRMGKNAGFATYTPLRFRQLNRFDYDEALCFEFHDAVEQAVVPAVDRLNEQRRTALGVDTLRPFDLEVDLEGRPGFRPFTTEPELIELVQQVFRTADPRFADEFQVLRDGNLLDLMSRHGKAPGGYQHTLQDVRLPFIFCNSAGTHDDVQTLLHEGGHAFHAILARDHRLLSYRHSPIEFAETASMSMELIGLENLATVYGAEEAQRTKCRHLEGLLRILPWIATIDAFQHWVYAHPEQDRFARETEWLSILDRFMPGLDYSGFEDARANRWTGQGHLFGHAFYYIEYGIAQIAALQIWQAYRRDKTAAIEAYRRALALGGSRPLPELFETAGVQFGVSAEMLGGLVADIEEQMARPGH